ncbi:uncharacterized protein [Macaca nemestrina]|uniref:uncharacterized protein isoform X6 n=1 Tax=Macaca nemestrina TaxID=9545 RepID=UPI0039B821B5
MTLHCLKVCSTFPFSLPPALAMEDLPAFPSPSAMTIESRLLLEGCFSSSGISVDLRTIQHEKMEPTNFGTSYCNCSGKTQLVYERDHVIYLKMKQKT